MCAVPLPPSIVSQLDQRRRAFLWTGENSSARGCSLVAWENVCQSKEEGGLGVKDLSLLNTCLLIKLIHRLHLASNSSWAAWVRAHVNLATMEGGVLGTHWDTLRGLLPIYQAISSSEVGDGRNTDFWHDAWSGQDDLASSFPALYSHCVKRKVSVRQVREEGLLLVPRLTSQATSELAAVQDIIAAVSLTTAPDRRLCSLADNNGKLRTGNLYALLKGSPRAQDGAVSFIWANRAPPRVQFFGWLLQKGRIQCKVNLCKKTILTEDICDICQQAPETASHIIFHCPFAVCFWAKIGIHIQPDMSVRELHTIPPPSGLPVKEFSSFVLLCCWGLWKRRNNFVFRQESATVEHMIRGCAGEARLWASRHKAKDLAIKDAWLRVFDAAMA